MSTTRELLEDTTFDREVAPKNQISNLLVSLIKKKAFNEKSAQLQSDYPIKAEEMDSLLKQGRIEMFSQSPMKIYLTPLGKLVALGELSLREREREK